MHESATILITKNEITNKIVMTKSEIIELSEIIKMLSFYLIKFCKPRRISYQVNQL